MNDMDEPIVDAPGDGMYDMDSWIAEASRYSVPSMPPINIDIPDSVSEQLRVLRSYVVGEYRRKPVEGLSADYVQQQYMFANTAALIIGYAEVVEDMIWNKTTFNGDVVMRLMKTFGMLTNPQATRSIVNGCPNVDSLENEGRAVGNRVAVGWEDCYKKSAVWATGSLIRIYAAGYLYDVQEDWVTGNIVTDSADIDDYLKYVAQVDFRMLAHNYNDYVNVPVRTTAYGRLINSDDMREPPKYECIEKYDPQHPPQPIQGAAKPLFVQKAISGSRRTMDALAVFSCDMRAEGNKQEQDSSLEIIATSDEDAVVRLDMPPNVSQSMIKRNQKLIKLRSLLVGDAARPFKTFRPPRSRSIQVSEYEKQPIFFTVPRMVRSANLFQCNAGMMRKGLVAEFNAKSFNGDVLDAMVGKQCIKQRCAHTVVSLGGSKSLIAYDSSIGEDEGRSDIEVVLASDIPADEFLGEADDFIPGVTTANMLSEFITRTRVIVGVYPNAHRHLPDIKSVVFYAVIRNAVDKEPLQLIEAVGRCVLCGLMNTDAVLGCVQFDREHMTMTIPGNALMRPRSEVEHDPPLYWMSHYHDGDELSTPAELAGSDAAGAVNNHFLLNIQRLYDIRLMLNPHDYQPPEGE